MKKLIIPTLIMSASAGSNAVANPMNIHFQGKVIKSSSGIHWYAKSRGKYHLTIPTFLPIQMRVRTISSTQPTQESQMILIIAPTKQSQ